MAAKTSSNAPKKKMSLRRRLTIAAAVALVALGIWLGKVLQFPGGFGGSGIGLTGPGQKQSQPSADDRHKADDSPANGATASVVSHQGKSSVKGEAGGLPELLEIRIEERSYSVRDARDENQPYQTVDLPQLIEQVRRTPGNADGVRVRIVRTAPARYTTETRLYEALERAGIPNDAIQKRDDFKP